MKNIGNSIALKELQEDEYVFLQNDNDIMSCVESIGYLSTDVSGAVVKIQDGEYQEVWITEYSRPFELHSIYTRVL